MKKKISIELDEKQYLELIKIYMLGINIAIFADHDRINNNSELDSALLTKIKECDYGNDFIYSPDFGFHIPSPELKQESRKITEKYFEEATMMKIHNFLSILGLLKEAQRRAKEVIREEEMYNSSPSPGVDLMKKFRFY
jgi:hypothetical protein